MGHVLEVKALTKSFPDASGARRVPVVKGVSFDVGEGEIFVLLGPSGCGKTTTLRMIGGFAEPDSGAVHLGERMLEGPGVRVRPEAREIGFVFQDYALFPHLSVEKNVAYGLRHLSRTERKQRVQEMLELVGLADFASRMPQQLSGGEQQRVALARSLARRPKLLLLDEPFSNLDEQRRAQMRDELRALLKAQGTSAVMVTHHQEEALVMGDRIGIMHQGMLKQVAQPSTLYHEPTSAFVADFLGYTNLLEAEASGERATTLLGEISIIPSSTGPVTLSLRPEALQLSSVEAGNGASVGTIEDLAFFGGFVRYQVAIAEGHIFVHVPGISDLQKGDEVCVSAVLPARVVAADLSPAA